MTPVDQPGPRRILLVRFGAMGDIIHSLPAAAALRRRLPEAQIDWLVEARWQALLQRGRTRFLDNVFAVDTFALRRNLLSPASWREMKSVVSGLRRHNYDVAVDLQGAIKSALVCKLSGAPVIVGFARPWLREEIAGFAYTRMVQGGRKHIVEANLDLVSSVYCGSRKDSFEPRIEFPLPVDKANAAARDLPEKGFAVLNPGAGWRSKRWPAPSAAALCEMLVARHGMKTVLNCGPGERPLGEQVIYACRLARPIIFEGSIPELIALLRNAALMVGPDTGPLHLAAALGVPAVGIYGPTDPERNGPYGPSVSTLRARDAQTTHRHGAPPDGSMDAISPEMVMAEIEKLLARQPQL